MIADLIEIKTFLRETITYVTSGDLTVDTRYRIVIAGTGNFSNVGSTYNKVQETFVATGTTPTLWGSAKLQVISDNDLIIESLIPIVTEHVHVICGTDFENDEVYLKGSELTFTSGDVQDTVSVASGFDGLYLNRYLDVKIVDSYYNDKHFTIYDFDDTTLTLDQLDNVFSEATACNIFRVDYPDSLLSPFSKMINYQLNNYNSTSPGSVKSEKIGKLYSVSYETQGSNNFYPQTIIQELQTASGKKDGGIYVVI